MGMMQRLRARIRPTGLWTAVAAAMYFLVLCYLSYSRPLSENREYFPDEQWRLQLPLYFYEHGTLPTGREEAVRMELWGFSYANYPLMLTTVVGGALMKVASLFTDNPDVLVFAARLVSVASATALAWFALRIGLRLFGRPVGWVFGLCVSMMPQVIFCGLYFNNDIVALAGAAMILYSWILGFQDSWRYSSACLLAAGVVIVSLSYYNAYSWILLSVIVYFASWFRRGGGWHRMDAVETRRFLTVTLLAVTIVICCVAPFFIRSAVLNIGDFLGLATVERYGNRYGAEGFSPATRMTPRRLGMSLWQMLTTDHYLGAGNNWLEFTAKSFVGVFGAMNVFLPVWVYWFYGVFFVAGMALWGIDVIRSCARHEYGFQRRILDGAMAANCVIVISLALLYSYATDYQAQGRYILPLLLSVAYCATTGWGTLLSAARMRNRYAYVGLFSGIVLCMALTAFSIYYLRP